MEELESPKLKKSLPKYLTLDQSKKLLSVIDGPNRERDYCIITLFLNCGMRLSELCGINLTDIKDDGSLRLLGKGNKERIVFFADGIIYEQAKFCDFWGYERMLAGHVLSDEYGIPTVGIDREYVVRGAGQLSTRVQAFVESLEIKRIQKGGGR